jgi:hypothetical protein
MDTLDNLQGILQAIRQRALEQSLRVVQGLRFSVKGNSSPEVDWKGEWTEYLDVAASVKAPLLYLEADPFDLERENLSLMSGYRGAKQPAGENEQLWLSERVIEATEEWRKHNGQLGYLRCAWFKEGVAHYLSLKAEWYIDYGDFVKSIMVQAENVEEEMRRVRTKEEAVTRLHLASQLARHERFPEATNDDKRRYMAEQLFPDNDEYDLREIVTLAQMVYWWEVEPELRAAKELKARDLWAKGETIRNIAAILKMPEAKVKTAIEEDNTGDSGFDW